MNAFNRLWNRTLWIGLAFVAMSLVTSVATARDDEEEQEVQARAAPTMHGQLRLSLADAVAMGIENNLNVAVARHDPLIAYEDRVKQAMTTILASRSWTQPQRKWLERIGKQLEKEVIVDKEALDRGQFKDHGGFARLNKVFDGQLAEILKEISDAVWQTAA